eukprot:g2189.t1
MDDAPSASKTQETSSDLTQIKRKKKRRKKRRKNKQKKKKKAPVVDPDDSDEDYSNDEDEGQEGYKKGGYHPVTIGEIYNDRYEVKTKLGWGHFSTVWMALDHIDRKYVALKVQKSAEHYTEAALDEIKLLGKVAEEGSDDDVPVVRLLDHFSHKGPNGDHACFVFEVLGENLLELIKYYDYKGVPLSIVKEITRQVCRGMAFLHDRCKIIHTDLKPENVLIACPKRSVLDRLEAYPLAATTCAHSSRTEIRIQRTTFVPKQRTMGPLRRDGVGEDESCEIANVRAELALPTLSSSRRKRLKKRLKRLVAQGSDDASLEMKFEAATVCDKDDVDKDHERYVFAVASIAVDGTRVLCAKSDGRVLLWIQKASAAKFIDSVDSARSCEMFVARVGAVERERWMQDLGVWF